MFTKGNTRSEKNFQPVLLSSHSSVYRVVCAASPTHERSLRMRVGELICKLSTRPLGGLSEGIGSHVMHLGCMRYVTASVSVVVAAYPGPKKQQQGNVSTQTLIVVSNRLTYGLRLTLCVADKLLVLTHVRRFEKLSGDLLSSTDHPNTKTMVTNFP
ncbi:hypothetical protein BaRGS_00013893 [Batillaria attramentaria]|uniref:Uncharacterized protein n=1 Tax=Batillaria attramentaria TaxID=370345 RepID=A0ABD0L6A4_9CAEN